MAFIIPAVLPQSRRDLEKKLEFFASLPSISRVQIDIVDGRFASPPSWPYIAPSELQYMVDHKQMLPHLDRITYEVDLMSTDAETMAESWLAVGATRLTFHAQGTTNLDHLLASVHRRYGDGPDFLSNLISLGLALDVSGDLALIEPRLDTIEYVQFMGISKIGRQGEPFDEHVLEKIRTFCLRHPGFPVQVDGGVKLDTAQKLANIGVSDLIVGSAILKAPDPAAALKELEAIRGPLDV